MHATNSLSIQHGSTRPHSCCFPGLRSDPPGAYFVRPEPERVSHGGRYSALTGNHELLVVIVICIRIGRLTSDMVFQPPPVLDSHGGDAAKNFPIALRLFSSTSDQTALYQLRYRAFLEAGWISENPERRFADRYDRLPSTFAVGAFHNGAYIGSLRLAFGGAGYGTRSLPCEEHFSKELRTLNAAGRARMVEFSRMAVEPSLTNLSFRTMLYASLVRAGLIVSNAADMDIALIAVHRRISPFYQAMCGFKVIGKSETYSGIEEPTNFLQLRFSEIEKRRSRSNTFFSFTAKEIDSTRQTILALQKKNAA